MCQICAIIKKKKIVAQRNVTSKHTPFKSLPVKIHKSTGGKGSTKDRNELQTIGFTEENINKIKYYCSFRDNNTAFYVSQLYF